MRTLKAGAVYFALTMLAGFTLGTIRLLMIEPRIGARWAEMAEMPVMLAIIICVARWTVRRYAVEQRLAMGFVAVALLLVTEFTIVLRARGMTIGDYIDRFDPVSGSAFFVVQAVFMVLPALIARRELSSKGEAGSKRFPRSWIHAS